MKWLTDPPTDWSTAPNEPPTGKTIDVPLEAEVGTGGVVLREPGSPEAYIRATAGAIDVADSA